MSGMTVLTMSMTALMVLKEPIFQSFDVIR